MCDGVSIFGLRRSSDLSVLIELTYHCNLDCFFCYNDLGRQGRPLALADYLRFFDDLADLGVMQLTFSGGEPLAHRDFFSLGKAARERGFLIRVKTNGHALKAAAARRMQIEIVGRESGLRWPKCAGFSEVELLFER